MPPLAYDLLNALRDGQLADFITERRNSGTSFEAIARELSVEHHISITGETVRRWWNDITAAAAATAEGAA